MATLVTKYCMSSMSSWVMTTPLTTWCGLASMSRNTQPKSSRPLCPTLSMHGIGILMLEGLVASAVTANWDGLLERALTRLTPAFSSLVRVVVRPEDFPTQDHESRSSSSMAVRCVREMTKPGIGTGRSRARKQISGWTEQPQNKSMRKHLEVLYTDRLTSMIGLSAQDANLHTVFAARSKTWPGRGSRRQRSCSAKSNWSPITGTF